MQQLVEAIVNHPLTSRKLRVFLVHWLNGLDGSRPKLTVAQAARDSGLLRADGLPDTDNFRSIRSALVRTRWLRRTPEGHEAIWDALSMAAPSPRVFVYLAGEDRHLLACSAGREWWVELNNYSRGAQLAPHLEFGSQPVRDFWTRSAAQAALSNPYLRHAVPDMAVQQALLWTAAHAPDLKDLDALGRALERITPPAHAPLERDIYADMQQLRDLGYLDLAEFIELA